MLNVIPEEAERGEWYAADLVSGKIHQVWPLPTRSSVGHVVRAIVV